MVPMRLIKVHQRVLSNNLLFWNLEGEQCFIVMYFLLSCNFHVPFGGLQEFVCTYFVGTHSQKTILLSGSFGSILTVKKPLN